MAKGYWIANVDVRNADGYKVWPPTGRTPEDEHRRSLFGAML
jgi:hypothetical protein